jgi:hypothetical protein
MAALTAADARVSAAFTTLRKVVRAVSSPDQGDSEYDKALEVLRTLSCKEGIPIAIIGGMAAIRHGYPRFTDDIDIVIARQHLDTIIRVAPTYRIKVLWHDPEGWHKLQYEGIRLEVVPEGGKPRKDAPTRIPGPGQLGVLQGSEYANLEGWIETKLASGRQLDRADVVQVLKKTDQAGVERVRTHLATVHPLYLRAFEDLVAMAAEEMQQEKERGGPR